MRKQIKPLIPIAVTAAMLAGASPALAEEIDTTPAEPDQTVTTPGEKQNTPTEGSDENQNGEQPENPAEEKDVVAEGDNGGWHIKLLGDTKTGKTSDGKTVLMVTAETTNNTGTDSSLSLVRFKAYQNGEELKYAMPDLDDPLYADYDADMEDDNTNIENGATRTNSEFFALASTEATDTVRVEVYANFTDTNVITGEFTPAGDPVTDEDVTPDENKPGDGEQTETPGDGEQTETPADPIVDALSEVAVTANGYTLASFNPSVVNYYVPGLDVDMSNLPEGWTVTPVTNEDGTSTVLHVENADKTLSRDYTFNQINTSSEDSEYSIDDLKDMKMLATTDGDPFEIEGFDPQQINYVVPGVTAVEAQVPDNWYATVMRSADNDAFVVYAIAPDNTYFAGWNIAASEDAAAPIPGEDEQNGDEQKTDDAAKDNGDAAADENGDSLPQTGVVAPFAALAGLGASLLAGLGVKFGSRKDE